MPRFFYPKTQIFCDIHGGEVKETGVVMLLCLVCPGRTFSGLL